MTNTVNVHEAKTHLSCLLEQARAGEEIILAMAGKSYARLVPVAAEPAPRCPGCLKGKIDTSRFIDALPAYELDASEGR